MAMEDSSKRVASMIVDGMGEDLGPAPMMGDEEMVDDEVSEGETVAAEEMMEALSTNDPVSFARAFKAFLSLA